MVPQAVGYGEARSSYVEERREPLQSVMSSTVKVVAQSHHANRFADEVRCQSGRASGEESRERVQFFAAIRQVGPRDRKISCTQSRYRAKQDPVLLVKKRML